MIGNYLFKLVNIIQEKVFDAKKSYSDEFNYELLYTNIRREKIFAGALIILTLAIISSNIMTISEEESYMSAARFSTGIFLLIFIAALVFLLYTRRIKKVGATNYKLLKGFHLLINFITLTLSALSAVNWARLNEHPFSYITAIFGITSSVYMNAHERLGIYIVPHAVYIVGILMVVQDTSILLGDIIFTVLLVIFALVISRINYCAYYKNFTQTKIIELKNQELDDLYKLADKTLKARTEELNMIKEYERLRTTFFANLSHELRTPINVIFSAEQMLDHLSRDGQRSWLEKDLSKYRKIIKQNCFRLIRMVSNLIDITKIDAGYFKINKKNCDIVKVVEDITLSVAEYIESKKIHLVFDTEIEEKVIACDPDTIERVMLNLLSNSVKYTQADGKILVNIYEKTGKIVISVKDTGIGIPEDMKPIIFDRFIQVDRTTTRANEGSGIGLSIVKALIELHDGTVRLESELGRGSEFIIEIPDRQIKVDIEAGQMESGKEHQYIEKISIEFSDIYD